MRNLIRASLYRVLKSRLFLGELCVALLLPIFILVSSYLGLNLTNAYVYKLIAQFFGHAPIIGVMAAVLSAKVCGQDCESGTLRNKLICGHDRKNIYLSQFITTALATLILTLTWLMVYMILGLPVLGLPGNVTTGELLIYIVSDLLLAIAFSALCTLLANICDTESKSLLLCLIMLGGFIIIGLILCKRFTIEQYNGWICYDDNPDIRYPAENRLYVGGAARIILEFVICFLPGAQSILIMNMDVEHLVFPGIGSIVIILLSTLAGLFYFQRKDIK